MNIYFADLGYISNKDYSLAIPLNAANMSSYVLKYLPNMKIKIFKDPVKLLDAVVEQKPDLLAMTHNAMNANLTIAIAKR